MQYCKKCVLPDTKPDLFIDDAGICSACRAFEARSKIDWVSRKSELIKILAKAKESASGGYDCLVPVSGGKDGFFQTWYVLQQGLTPLCVCATTCDLTPIGKRNLANLSALGVDLLEFSPNPVVRKKLNAVGLREVGDISWPEHLSIFTFPFHIAQKFDIPLLVWGENPQNEYGGPVASQDSVLLDRAWLAEFGGLLGLRIEDFTDIYGFDKRSLSPYFYPDDDSLSHRGIRGIFLGRYLSWDSYSNVLVAQSNGWESWPTRVEGHFVNYENLDNFQAGIHEYFKFLKFGFGRASDQLSVNIRRGRVARQDAIELLPLLEGGRPLSYLGKPLEEIIAPLGISLTEFWSICNRFTNSAIFEQDNDGFHVDEKGDLVKRSECIIT